MRVITSQAFISALVVAFIFLAFVPSGAHAYIDPGHRKLHYPTTCGWFPEFGLFNQDLLV